MILALLAGPGLMMGQIDVINNPPGQVTFQPLYQGQPLSSLTGTAYSVQGIVTNNATFGYNFEVRPGQGATTETFPIGAYSASTRRYSNYATITPVSSLTVTSGNLTTYQPELSTHMGLVRATVRVNGSLPPANQYYVQTDPWENALANVDGNGLFRMLLPAGTYTGTVYGPSGTVPAPFPFTVVAGQELDLGTLAITNSPPGQVTFDPLYQGQPLSAMTGIAYTVQGLVTNNATFGQNFEVRTGQSASPTTFPIGTYSTSTRRYSNYANLTPVGSLTVTSGNLTTYQPELSTNMGLVRATILVNGSLPPPNQYHVQTDPWENTLAYADGNGLFRMLLPAGTYTATVYGPIGAVPASFPFTIVAGQEIDLGSWAIANHPPGQVTFDPLYKGQPLSGLTGAAYALQGLVTNNATFGYNFNVHTGQSASPTTFPIGSYSAIVKRNSNYAVLVPTTTLTVTSGNLSTYRPELSAQMGLVRGIIRVNGSFPPANQYYVQTDPWENAVSYVGSNGLFRMLLPAGAYTGTVYGPVGTVPLSFPFTVLAGQEIDLGSPGAMAFLGILGTRGGTQTARTLNVSLRNTSVLAYLATTGKMKLTYVSGQACSPTIAAPNPITYGDFAGGATILKTFTLNVTGCSLSGPTASRFKMELEITSGASTTTITVAPATTL